MFRDTAGRLHKSNGKYAKESGSRSIKPMRRGGEMDGGFAALPLALGALAVTKGLQAIKPATHLQNVLRSNGATHNKVGRAFDKGLEIGKQLGFGAAQESMDGGKRRKNKTLKVHRGTGIKQQPTSSKSVTILR